MVRSNCGGEYYGKYDSLDEQYPGPFAKFLPECDIIVQYSMLDSPTMNVVAEK